MAYCGSAAVIRFIPAATTHRKRAGIHERSRQQQGNKRVRTKGCAIRGEGQGDEGRAGKTGLTCRA